MRWWMWLVALVVVVCVSARGFAGEADPDTEIARRHTAAAIDAYAEGRYAQAVKEFEAARLVRPLAAIDYNIGRCYDRMERWTEAIAAYEAYVREEPHAPDAAAARRRIAELERRIGRAELGPTLGVAPRRRSLLLPAAVGAGAVVGVGVGLALVLSSLTEYGNLVASCSPHCSASSWSGARVEQLAGDVLLAAGGVAALVDVVLWGRYARRDPGVAWVAPASTGAGLVVGGRF